MRFRNTLLAVLALGGLIAWIYFYEYRGEEGREKTAAAEKKVFVFESDKADALDLIRPGATVSLRKEGGEWKMTSPITARADGDEVSGLLSSLSWLEVSQKIKASPEDLDAYKLKDPPLKVVLSPGEGKPPVTLALGDKAPIGSVYYALKDGGPDVLTVSSSVDRLLEATADKLRYKKVLGIDSWKVGRFTIARGGSLVAFAKTGEEWRIESPSAFPAERGKVSNLLYDLSGITAEGFEPEGTAPGAVGLDKPEATLKIEPGGGAPVTVEFSAKDAGGMVRARRTDMPDIFRVKADILDKLAVNPAEYRDGRVAPVDRYGISEIRAVTPEGDKQVVKDAESNWRWGGADGPTLESKDVDSLLDALDSTKATEFLEGAGAAKGIGTGSPPIRITVRAGSAAPVEVRIGSAEGAKVLVGSSASTAVYKVDKALADKLIESIRGLRPPPAVAGTVPAASPNAPEEKAAPPPALPAAPAGAGGGL